jgi:hypothetical protein
MIWVAGRIGPVTARRCTPTYRLNTVGIGAQIDVLVVTSNLFRRA